MHTFPATEHIASLRIRAFQLALKGWFHKRLRAFQVAIKRLFHKRLCAFQVALRAIYRIIIPDSSQDFSLDFEPQAILLKRLPKARQSSAFWLRFWLKIFIEHAPIGYLPNLTNVRNNYSCNSHQARVPQKIASYALTVNTRKC